MAALVPNVFLCQLGKGALSGWRGHPAPWSLPSCIILPPGSQQVEDLVRCFACMPPGSCLHRCEFV